MRKKKRRKKKEKKKKRKTPPSISFSTCPFCSEDLCVLSGKSFNSFVKKKELLVTSLVKPLKDIICSTNMTIEWTTLECLIMAQVRD